VSFTTISKQKHHANEIRILEPHVNEVHVQGKELADDTLMSLTFVHHTRRVTQLITVLEAHGFTVVSSTGDHIDTTSSYANLAKVLNAQLFVFHIVGDEKTYYNHVEAVHIPEAFVGVRHIFGLSNVPASETRLDMRTHAPNTPATGALSSFTPVQIANLYKFPAFTGTGQIIGIIQLGGGYTPQDLNAYFGSLGLATPTVVAVSADGIATNNPADLESSVEVLLDIQVAGAVAPGAKIVVYFGTNSYAGFYKAIQAAINDTVHAPSIISISWGAPEKLWPRTVLRQYNTLFASAVAKNINVFAACGNEGSSNGLPGVNVDFPASSPNVIACGGTRLSSNGVTIFNETVWNSSGGATGGGFSKFFKKASYQKSSKNAFRGLPDLCGNADPLTGYRILVRGSPKVVGGTSAVSPLMAGLCARVNEAKQARVGFWNIKMYKAPSTLWTDIVSGKNGVYSASKGWDACTGLGRINGALSIPSL